MARTNPSKVNNKSETYKDFLFNNQLADSVLNRKLYALYKESNYGYSTRWMKKITMMGEAK